jgi:hypothetical protein
MMATPPAVSVLRQELKNQKSLVASTGTIFKPSFIKINQVFEILLSMGTYTLIRRYHKRLFPDFHLFMISFNDTFNIFDKIEKGVEGSDCVVIWGTVPEFT